MIGEPKIVEHAEQAYLGIRTQTPFRGMFKQVSILFKELNKWVKQHGIENTGPRLLRYHVIDMEGEMDIEVGVVVAPTEVGDERVKPGIIPAGRYASLIYTNSGMAGNKALIGWAIANELAFDQWDDPKGRGFRSRYEAYLTDPKIEPRKTKWDIEVAIKLADKK